MDPASTISGSEGMVTDRGAGPPAEDAGDKTQAFYQDKDLLLFAMGPDYATDHDERSAHLQKQKGT